MARKPRGTDLSEVIDWIRGEAGTKVTVTVRNGAMATTASTPSNARRRPGAVRLVDAWSRARAPRCWPSTGSRTAPPTRPSTPSRRSRRPGRTGSSSTCAATRAAMSTRPIGVASQFLTKGDVYIERDADGHETHHPVSAGRRRDRHPDGRPRRRQHGQLRRDRLRRAAGCEAGRDHRHRDLRHRARSSASSRCPTGRRCASARSSGSRRAAAGSGTRASSRTSSSSAPRTSRRSPPTRSGASRRPRSTRSRTRSWRKALSLVASIS